LPIRFSNSLASYEVVILRENFSQRAEPPITRTLILDENTRRLSSSAFTNATEP